MKRNLSALVENTYDVLVVGGGIYGAFVAWEAVLRGLSVALVERDDFGGATSANCQKIIHGGFRYLQHADFKRMRESIRERSVLMRIAPHLVHPLPVLIPTYGHGMRGKEILKFALAIYDLVSFDRNHRLSDPEKRIARGHLLSKKEVLNVLPDLAQENLNGGAVFYDGQVSNSERLTLAVLKSSEEMGVRLANYVRVIGFLKEGKEIKGVHAEDCITKQCFPIRAKMVVNTSGPWVYQVLGLLDQLKTKTRFPLVKSVNLVTRMLFQAYAVGIYGKSYYEDKDAILDKGARLFFVTPWNGHSIVGTALSYYEGNPDALEVTGEDIQRFLDEFNAAYPGATLKREDVSFVHRGFLPSSGLSSKTSDVQISKKYQILDHRREGIYGLISVVGVKYTTARDVAEKTLDYVFRVWNQKSPKSLSSTTCVYGGKIERFNDFLTEQMKKYPSEIKGAIKSLVHNYGSAYLDVLKCLNFGNMQDMRPEDILRAEVLYGVREEMAVKLVDILMRRTEIGSAGNPGEQVQSFCAKVMGEELRWDVQKTQSELEEIRKMYVF